MSPLYPWCRCRVISDLSAFFAIILRFALIPAANPFITLFCKLYRVVCGSPPALLVFSLPFFMASFFKNTQNTVQTCELVPSMLALVAKIESIFQMFAPTIVLSLRHTVPESGLLPKHAILAGDTPQ